jgi:oligopeptide/dipeptide ABC transporter ATP-binding protein
MDAVDHINVDVDRLDACYPFYRDTLGLVVRDDETMETEDGVRWLTVSSPDREFPQIALVEADTPEKRERVGSQVADHVNLVFATDDFDAEHERLQEAGVEFHGEPMENPWGTEALFEEPRHPYTEALVSAVSSPDPRRRSDRIVLDGEIPDPKAPPTGCNFASRCPKVFEACHGCDPDLVAVDRVDGGSAGRGDDGGDGTGDAERAVACLLHSDATRPDSS